MNFIKLYAIAILIFPILDLLWVGLLAQSFYREQIGHLMAGDIRWGAVLLFYFLYAFGLTFFAISPAIRENVPVQAFVYGALFGLICYGTYDLTNLATLIRWPVKMVCYDMIWGGFVSGAVSLITYWIGKHFIQSL